MANMNYCKFENTSHDLFSCLTTLRNFEDLSESEKMHAATMARYCQKYIYAYENWIERREEE